jgi:hypothetical protein
MNIVERGKVGCVLFVEAEELLELECGPRNNLYCYKTNRIGTVGWIFLIT